MPNGAQRKKQRKAAKVPPADHCAATTEPMEGATTPDALPPKKTEGGGRVDEAEQEAEAFRQMNAAEQ